MIVVYDLELTCWAERDPERMEIIEIGAVSMDLTTGEIRSAFESFVKPVIIQTLSDYCTNLTGISQDQVDEAYTFPTVYKAFADWLVSQNPSLTVGYGKDHFGVQRECERHGLEMYDLPYMNLKETMQNKGLIKREGLAKALRKHGLEFEGTRHRALSDASATAKLLYAVKDHIF